jgi:hypothetical protein
MRRGTRANTGNAEPQNSTLITGSSSTVTLINGAEAARVFWQVGSLVEDHAATLSAGSAHCHGRYARGSPMPSRRARVAVGDAPFGSRLLAQRHYRVVPLLRAPERNP